MSRAFNATGAPLNIGEKDWQNRLLSSLAALRVRRWRGKRRLKAI
jgi:hypothetical protein